MRWIFTRCVLSSWRRGGICGRELGCDRKEGSCGSWWGGVGAGGEVLRGAGMDVDRRFIGREEGG